MLYVDPDSLDSQAAFLAPTARDVRTQRRDTPRSATLDNPPSQPIASVQRDVSLASPFVLLPRNLRVLLRYSRTFPSLKHSCDSFNLPSLSSRTKTNPLMGNRKSSCRPLRHESVTTTLTSTSYSDTVLACGDTTVYCETSSSWDHDADTAVPQRNRTFPYHSHFWDADN